MIKLPSFHELVSSLPVNVRLKLHQVINELDKIFLNVDMPTRLYSAVRHYIINKGKLVRPTLALLITYLLNGDLNLSINAAVAVELVHLASLLQDDIIDKQEVRRGVETPYKLFGAEYTLLASDLLISKAIEYIVKTKNDEVINELINASIRLAIGQSYELEYLERSHELELDVYLKIINYKTASLIESAMVMGAHLSKVSREVIEKIREVGKYIGIAFQVRDDIIDYLNLDKNNPSTQSKELNIVKILEKNYGNNAINEAYRLLNRSLEYAINLIKSLISSVDVSSLIRYVEYLRLDKVMM